MTDNDASRSSWPEPEFESPRDYGWGRAEADGNEGGHDGGPAALDPADEQADDEETKTDSEAAEQGVVAGLIEWAVLIVGALVVALLVRAFVFQAFYIPSESMEMTLIENDRVIVNKLSYRLHDVNRGDLVVFARPPSEPPTEIPELIKRVVGLPGETIEGRDGALYIDGRRLIEPYVNDDSRAGWMESFGPVAIPEGHVFVMGDNRNNSRDSRMFGPIDEDSIVGRAFVLVWPPSRWAFL